MTVLFEHEVVNTAENHPDNNTNCIILFITV